MPGNGGHFKTWKAKGTPVIKTLCSGEGLLSDKGGVFRNKHMVWRISMREQWSWNDPMQGFWINLLQITEQMPLFKLCTPTIVNDCLLGKTPQKFHNYYKEHKSVYDLRNLGLTVKRSRTTQGSLSLSILVTNVWNGLSHTLKEHHHKMCFRKILVKSHIANSRNWMMTTVYLNILICFNVLKCIKLTLSCIEG